MHARRNLLALCSALAAMLAACASDIDVSTTVDPLATFPAQATYIWDESAIRPLPADPRIRKLDPDSLIREAANAEFAARGYRLAASGPAHYRLAYDFQVHTWKGPDSLSLGSLSLWLSDADKRRVWMGYARAEIYIGLSHEERVARMREAIAGMLRHFPPKQRGK